MVREHGGVGDERGGGSCENDAVSDRTTGPWHRLPVSDIVLDHEFTATKPNQMRVIDVTDIPTQEWYLFMALVVDLFSRGSSGGRWTRS